MSWSTYVILIIFAAFVLLLIINPNMSCFGKRITSPFYPILRKKRPKGKAGAATGAGEKAAQKTEDYGFH
ncbi:MAG: hypothetical protein A2Y70_05065 [Candidatus Aminicenantes bacterium RBG_13_64_14]|nr:MAG: hypothetical protein A2Y70_05065 [Candidatus Aminicenantes bacterium RBG_13_64_14]